MLLVALLVSVLVVDIFVVVLIAAAEVVEVVVLVVEAEVVKYNYIDSNNSLEPCKLVLARISSDRPQLISRTTHDYFAKVNKSL